MQQQSLGHTKQLVYAALGIYGAEGIIYGNWLVPMASIPGNVVQIGVAAVIVLPIVAKLRKRLDASS